VIYPETIRLRAHEPGTRAGIRGHTPRIRGKHRGKPQKFRRTSGRARNRPGFRNFPRRAAMRQTIAAARVATTPPISQPPRCATIRPIPVAARTNPPTHSPEPASTPTAITNGPRAAYNLAAHFPPGLVRTTVARRGCHSAFSPRQEAISACLHDGYRSGSRRKTERGEL
jgi:hypothetical protein